MIAALGDVVEVGPFQLACGRGVQQQATCVEAALPGTVASRRSRSTMRHVAIAIDGNKPRAHQWGPVGRRL